MWFACNPMMCLIKQKYAIFQFTYSEQSIPYGEYISVSSCDRYFEDTPSSTYGMHGTVCTVCAHL